MPSIWTNPVEGLYVHTTDGINCCAVSIDIDSGKYIVLNVIDKPRVSLQCNHEFDTVDDAKQHTKFSLFHHDYGEHKTYTGPGCAQCGRDRNVHFTERHS